MCAHMRVCVKKESVWLSAWARSFIMKWGMAAQQKLRTEQEYDEV